MQHSIPTDQLGPQGEVMAEAVGSCVHCGFCLPTCPTYVELGEEMDSPRGRIFLMKEVLEGGVELDLATPYLDNCLGCQACQTACPSGVQYGELVTSFRAHTESLRQRKPAERALRTTVLQTLPHPKRFHAAAKVGRRAKPLARALPGPLSTMLDLLPDELPEPQPLPTFHPAEGERRARVALLAGCAQQVLAPGINWATLRVLARNGVETVIPEGQGCCGSLALHTGAIDDARRAARRNLSAFPTDVDAVITNAAGCGSGMKEYSLVFAGEPEQEAADQFAKRVSDVSAFLASLGLSEPPPRLDEPLRVAYHDACHLAHAQGVRSEPRELLGAIGGLELVEPDEWELCCGSAGTYNLERPEIAASLGARKATNLLNTGAQLIATGNIGCMTQVETHLRAMGRQLPILHTMQILDQAYAQTLKESS